MVMANVETRRDENTFLGTRLQQSYEHILSMSGGLTSSLLYRDLVWALGKIQGEEPLFSCMELSFEERFGNVGEHMLLSRPLTAPYAPRAPLADLRCEPLNLLSSG